MKNIHFAYGSHTANKIRHEMVDCTDWPKDDKKKLLDKYHNAKKSNKAKRAKNTTTTTSIQQSTSSVLFNATFDGKLVQTVCAHIAALENLMDKDLFHKFTNNQLDLKIETLQKPVVIKMAAVTENGTVT